MNYEKIYYDLIERARLLNRNKKDGYYEKHHIKPKCLNGGNNKENIVLLTAREHFIAHLLLIQFHKGKERAKLSFGLFQMCRKNNQHKRIISSKQFETAKKIMSENCRGKNSSFYGRAHTDETKEKLRNRMIGDENPSKKFGVWNKGKKTGPLSNEQKRKISLAHTGYKHSKEAKEKISKKHLGVSKTTIHKERLSKALKGNKRKMESIKQGADKLRNKKQKILICPYCCLSGGTTMYRWHFENCKYKSYATK